MHRLFYGRLGLGTRVQLTLALVALAGFAVVSAVGLGVGLHGRSETLYSLEYWQSRLEEETRAPEAPHPPSGFESPRSRIQRLESELDAVPGRLFVMGTMFALASILVILGFKALRSGRHLP